LPIVRGVVVTFKPFLCGGPLFRRCPPNIRPGLRLPASLLGSLAENSARAVGGGNSASGRVLLMSCAGRSVCRCVLLAGNILCTELAGYHPNHTQEQYTHLNDNTPLAILARWNRFPLGPVPCRILRTSRGVQDSRQFRGAGSNSQDSQARRWLHTAFLTHRI
jgi:hypothetical protein